MIPKPFDAISKAEIDALVTNAVIEIKTLEYKAELPGASDKERKEFLADVSSFANAAGGDILYGVKEAVDDAGKKTGTPESVQPITATTTDDAKLRIENLIRDGIRPRLAVQVKAVPGWGGDERGFVLLVRIPQSFASPHMVTLGGGSRFFSRNSAGKYPLDVDELRAAFLATESQGSRIKHFREDRLGKILAGETPVHLFGSLRLVLHLIPIPSFLKSDRLDLRDEHLLLNRFRPMLGMNLDGRYNLDGYVTWIPAGDQTRSYCQLFSHGAVEAAGGDGVVGGTSKDNRTVIVSSYEADVVIAIEQYLEAYRAIGVSPPVVIALSLLGCRGACLMPEGYHDGRTVHTIDRDAVVLPEVIIDSLDVDVPEVMKPVFDSLWNASGFPRSFNYNADGTWKLKQR